MYGQGNYGPQYAQGPQRSMPPYQQPPAGHPLLPPPPPPYAVPPRGCAYPLGPPPPPPSMTQQGPSGSMSNTGSAYLQPPMNVHGGAGPSPFPAGLPLPPSSSIGLPRVPPPPPPLHGQAMYGLPAHQQGIHHMPLQPPLPPGGLAAQPPPPPPPPSSPPKPPPPPSSSSPSSSGNFSSAPVSSAANATVQSGGVPSSVPMSESGAKIAAHSDNRNDASIYAASAVQDLPPPPPKPADEKVVRNIEVLCQFIAKNGPGFEDMARQKESGNPEFNFLIGGEPGSEASCANEYYLWMKTKCNLESGLDKGQGERDLSQGHADVVPSVKPDAVTRLETSRSPVDSDVDMEDDITQSEKELGVSNSVQPETVSTGDMLEVQKQENGPEYSRESTPALNLSSSVDSLADAKHKPENSSGQVTKIDSPMRLIQNYASDDTSEDDCDPFHEEAKIVKVSPPHKSGFTSSHEDIVHGTMNSKSGKASKLQIVESVTACPGSMLTKDLDKPESVQSGVHEKVNELSSLGKIEGHGKTDRAETSSPNADIQGNFVLDSSAFNTISRYKEIENVDRKNTSGDLKVDEFGRLVKAGASDSESDGSYRTRRHGRRGRSRSRSRSPSDRRRRRSPRRSPRRRKERRSRSRSWSPKRRRSRSRSPYRPGDDAGSEKPRRDKVQKRECFDFLKGRCYRGASCRYLHHELEKSDSGRHYKSKEHHREVVASTRSSGFDGGDVSSRLIQQNNEDKGEKMHLHLDKHDGGGFSSKSYDEKSKEDSLHDAVRPSLLHKDETFAADAQKGEVSTEGDAQIQGASDKAVSNVPTVANNPLPDMPSADEQVIQNSQAETSVQAHHSLEDDTHKMDKSTKIDSSTIQMSAASLSEVPVSEPVPGNMSKVPAGPSAPTPDPSQVSCFPPLLPLQATSLPQASNQADYKLMAPSVSFPPQSAPIGNVPAYQAPMPNHPSHYPMPVNTAWSIQPPPQLRPPYVNESSMPGAPFQFQQGNLSLRNDFPSQVGFQHQPYHLHPSNLPTQPFAGASLLQDDRYSQLTSQGLAISSSLAPGSMPPQPIPFPGDSSVKNMQSYPSDNLALSEPAKPTFQNHSFPHPQAAADSMSSHLGGYSSGLYRNHSSRFLDIGGSKISAHYNPYASTFDQPLPSRFSSAAFTHERDVAAGSKYDSLFSLGNAPIGQIPSGHGSRKMVVSPNSSRARGQTLPMSGGDQYDPLFDSIEPSSGSYKKQAQKQDHGADNSDIMLKFNSRHKVLDVEENNKQKEVGVVAASVSMENDEYGETADAEVGAVENGSPSNADEDAIVAEGEIEIDQVKPEGKSKKNKDSRSMKLFKVAVATFVKEVLKPQWRQGNMSKEVFKTIVKKTVDKVSGAMKNHRVPKSQAKIDHYIDSSRRKLTQLVEGYVSKYKS